MLFYGCSLHGLNNGFMSPQGCRPTGKCRVNGRKYVKEVSSSILTPIYPCPMLVGCVDAPGGYSGSRRESTPCHASTRTEPNVVDSASTKKKKWGGRGPIVIIVEAIQCKVD
jgi:hypothetical protein